MTQRIRFGRARQQPAWPLRRNLEPVAENPLDALAREEARLFSHFERRADVDAPTESRILAFGVLPNAVHIDIRGPAIRERRHQARKEPHRPEIHVLLKTLP